MFIWAKYAESNLLPFDICIQIIRSRCVTLLSVIGGFSLENRIDFEVEIKFYFFSFAWSRPKCVLHSFISWKCTRNLPRTAWRCLCATWEISFESKLMMPIEPNTVALGVALKIDNSVNNISHVEHFDFFGHSIIDEYCIYAGVAFYCHWCASILRWMIRTWPA